MANDVPRFPSPVEGGFCFEVASRAVFGEGYLEDRGAPSPGRRVSVCLEWNGVDQLEVRGEVVHVAEDDVVGVALEVPVNARGTVNARGKPRTFVGILIRGDVDLARSTASRTMAAWRLALLVLADSVDLDASAVVRATRSAIVSP
jgi:hypothetical protein